MVVTFVADLPLQILKPAEKKQKYVLGSKSSKPNTPRKGK
jgi:hypothetical protein